MALGDPIRRNVAQISGTERARLRDAFPAPDTGQVYPDGVTVSDRDSHTAAHAGVHEVRLRGVRPRHCVVSTGPLEPRASSGNRGHWAPPDIRDGTVRRVPISDVSPAQLTIDRPVR